MAGRPPQTGGVTKAELVTLDGVAGRGPRIHGALCRADNQRIAGILIHPTSNFFDHYLMPLLPAAGISTLALNTRYLGDDSHVIFERLIEDLGAGVHYLRKEGFGKIILLGNSGGASTVALYQAEAEDPRITETPAGDPVHLSLPPADGIALFGAHPGRALVLANWLDASLTDEADPLSRDPALDIYNPANGPPFAPDFVKRVRARQLARSRNITNWAHARLKTIRAIPDGPRDQAFMVHRTCADPRFLDLSLDPNDRAAGMVWGDPRRINDGARDVARFTTLTSWLSQWSLESRAHGPDCIRRTSVPVITMEFTADTNVLPSDTAMWTEALGDRQNLHAIKGATHFLSGQRAAQDEVTALIADWAEKI